MATKELGKRLRDRISADIRHDAGLAGAYQLKDLPADDRRIVVVPPGAPESEQEIVSKEAWLRIVRDQRTAKRVERTE